MHTCAGESCSWRGKLECHKPLSCRAPCFVAASRKDSFWVTGSGHVVVERVLYVCLNAPCSCFHNGGMEWNIWICSFKVCLVQRTEREEREWKESDLIRFCV